MGSTLEISFTEDIFQHASNPSHHLKIASSRMEMPPPHVCDHQQSYLGWFGRSSCDWKVGWAISWYDADGDPYSQPPALAALRIIPLQTAFNPIAAHISTQEHRLATAKWEGAKLSGW
jgi:hypothetical protein